MDPQNKLIPYNIISAFDKQIQPKLGPQRTTNLYIIDSQDPENPPALYDMPGIETRFLIGPDNTAICRSLITVGEYMYAVYGNCIYRIDSNGTQVLLGNMSTNQGYVRYAVNQTQIIWVDQIDGYVWNFKTEIATFPLDRNGTAETFPYQPLDITEQNGYGICLAGSTNQWVYCQLNDFTIWNLDTGGIYQLNSNTTTVKGCTSLNLKLFIMGEIVTEQWFNQVGSNTQPFARNNTLLFQYGTKATASLVTDYNCMCWLAYTKNGVDSIKISTGDFPFSISSPELEYLIREYERAGNITDATAMMYKENGRIFYEITFPTANKTWVCDISNIINPVENGRPPQECWYEKIMNDGTRFVGQQSCYYQGIHYMGSGVDNRLFEMSSDIDTYDGVNFVRRIIGSTFESPTLRKRSVTRWQFDFQMGNASSQGFTSNPIVYFSVSYDSGVSFGNRRIKSMGKIGQRTFRVFFNNCGSHQMFTPMLEFYNNLTTAIVKSIITCQECER